MKKLPLKVVSLSIVVENFLTDDVQTEMINSHLAQKGLYCMGTHVRDITTDEEAEVRSQLPPDIVTSLEEE